MGKNLKRFWLLVFVGLFIALPTIASWASTISVLYFWSDPSGVTRFEVKEDWWSADQVQSSLKPSGYDVTGLNLFQYTIGLAGPGSGSWASIKYFKVNNPYGVSAKYVQSLYWFGTTVWKFDGLTTVGTTGTYRIYDTSGYTGDWTWIFESNGGIIGDVDYFRIWTSAPRGIVTGLAADNTDGTYPETASGPVSGPVPEPTTLLLLGSGLVGLAAYARRKTKKAS